MLMTMTLGMSEWGKYSTPKLEKYLLRSSLSVNIYSGLQL